MKQNSKLWSILCVALVLVLLGGIGLTTAVIDPYFHYHQPLEGLSYPMNKQRYQNDGISRNFDFDALITGTSMTENYKTTEFDRLFGVNSVKLSFSGGTFPELISNLEQALEHNSDIRLVLFCMDEWFLSSGKEMILADGSYPTYLYDDNPFNDVEYLVNREIFWDSTMTVLANTKKGLPSTSFDDFGSWVYPYDKQVVLENYHRPEQEEPQPVAQWEKDLLRSTMNDTFIKMAREHRDTQFIVYFPPYSVLNWDQDIREGLFPRNVRLYELACEILLQEENIQVFSFHSDYETITNLDNYRDTVHHSDVINSLLLERFHSGEYRLTLENYRQHWQEVEEFYRSFDYEALLNGS